MTKIEQVKLGKRKTKQQKKTDQIFSSHTTNIVEVVASSFLFSPLLLSFLLLLNGLEQ